MMRAPLKARAWVIGTVALGAGLIVTALFERAGAPLTTLALLGAAVVVTELMHVPPDEGSPDPGDVHSFSLSTGVHIATVLIIGPWTGALVAAFGVVVADRLRGSQWRHITYNASVFALTAVTSGYLFVALGGVPGALELPRDFPALAALAAAAYLLNTLFMSAVVALESSESPSRLTGEALRDGLATAAEETGFGVALAFLALTEPWAIVALVPLVVALFHSCERLAGLRRETAHALETFANVVDERDPYTYQHSARVAEYVRALAEGLGLPSSQVARLRWAGRLHDLGKIAVDAAVLRKPGKLDDSEWTSVHLHPRLSSRLLRRFRFAAHEARAVEYHHERVDGRGYYGIEAGEIPLGAHFLIVADSFDAMTSDRPYRRGLPVDEALAEIERNAGAQFHPAVAKAFVALQRGLDPALALSDEERAELTRLVAAQGRRSLKRFAPRRLELVVAGSIVAALGAVGLGIPIAAAPALTVAAGGLAFARVRAHRADRLTARLKTVCAETSERDEAFPRLVAELGRAVDVRWAGLLSWWERDCSGLLEVEWSGGAEGPTETALTSWLIREAEAASDPVVAPGAELGRENVHLAVPLKRDGSVVGFLVLAVGRHWSLPLADVLGSCTGPITERLQPTTLPSAPALEAIAS